MMKLRLSLKSLIKLGPLLNLYIISCLIFGCSFSTEPTYIKEDIDKAIQDICKKEYNIDITTKLIGKTLWVYIPVEDLFEKIDSKNKPEKYTEMFSIKGTISKDQIERVGINWNNFIEKMSKNNWADNEGPAEIRLKGNLDAEKELMIAAFGNEFLKIWPILQQPNNDDVKFNEGRLRLKYRIEVVPEQEKIQEYGYNKKVAEKINNVWKVLRRVLFSMGSSRVGPEFFSIVTADIKSGFVIREIFYYQDVKKVSYEFISVGEYQHRTIHDTEITNSVIGDKEGKNINYKDITKEEFIAAQIQHRIKLKFQKPEVRQNADIDREILKIVVHTLKTYNFKDFSFAELENMISKNKITLNQAAIWERPLECKF